jgi:hypothetical protein
MVSVLGESLTRSVEPACCANADGSMIAPASATIEAPANGDDVRAPTIDGTEPSAARAGWQLARRSLGFYG